MIWVLLAALAMYLELVYMSPSPTLLTQDLVCDFLQISRAIDYRIEHADKVAPDAPLTQLPRSHHVRFEAIHQILPHWIQLPKGRLLEQHRINGSKSPPKLLP